MNKRGLIIILSVAALFAAVLLTYLLPLYYEPAYLTVKLIFPVTKYPNGTTVVNPVLQFVNGGLAVLMLPNGSQYVFNITSVNGFMSLYRVMPQAFIKLSGSKAIVLIIPNAFRGWVRVRGVNVTLTYYFYNYTVINGSSLELTYLLDNQVLQELNKTDPSLLKYVPYAINVLLAKPSEYGDNIIETAAIKWILKDMLGLILAKSDQYVQYETDCVLNIYWATGWINVGGIPGYTFYNKITIGGQVWSGRGNLAAPQIPFSPPVSFVQVKESTGFYFGINENGYGIYGQVATGSVTWDLYPAGIYYVTSGTAILNSPSSSGWLSICG
ncbi:hypothetical protein Vdis_0513 [Vulcanisaeta distributa DSM 14429]|uniref:Uncharacterized protein n=2 Tax=Vulcanisaeta distributa TaxID=164451 RepID=E1QUI6_VULDI|nr:hypothetical protein Vdis_0513 [Vulcanisaeta distributa DSM 14429]